MADAAVVHPPTQRYALITGANKGIGFQICRQLASKGMVVILASRDEKRGIEARQKLKEFDNLVFLQLDVVDPASVAAAVEFIKTRFGRLDILGFEEWMWMEIFLCFKSILRQTAHYLNLEARQSLFIRKQMEGFWRHLREQKSALTQTTMVSIVKTITQALIPLLQLSHSPTIVNVSSSLGSLVFQPNEWTKGVLSSEDDSLTEERVDQVVQQFLNNFKEGSLEQNQWPPHLAAYKVSKAALNAYTRLIAKQHPSFCINAVCPGYARTDITYNSGPLSEAEAAEAPVKLALLSRGGPSGSFYHRMEALAL